jgi:hypothetical protein
LIQCGIQEPIWVIGVSALVPPFGFIAQVAHQHHPPSSGEYAKLFLKLKSARQRLRMERKSAAA